MKKTKKAQNNNFRNTYDLDLPAQIDMDTLACVLDDDLERRHSFLHAERDKAARLECDPKPWETEICYVQRELKIRADRRLAHEKYIRNNPDAAFYSYAAPVSNVSDDSNAN